MRETDLYIEIVDKETGKPLPEGEEGEIVFTTLTREGMPLIRYRTGDISKIVKGKCPCGCGLKRLSNIKRIKDSVLLKAGELSMRDLDRVLFTFFQILDFKARLHNGALKLGISCHKGEYLSKKTVLSALERIPALVGAPVEIEIIKNGGFLYPRGGKRMIIA